ncbi:MAG: 2-oxoglutarate dehydrogenase [Paenibacillus sp.]|nr:2-oxoglutarate dehydrogenase [Paenibacillus sp.]
MKAITIIQPWATLIAIGAKHFETRSWPTKYRGPLAIHAGKKVDLEACEREPIKSALTGYLYTAKTLPTGVIVATCNLTECRKIRRTNGEDGPVWLDKAGHTIGWGGILPKEYYFGNYEDGRYAWELTDIKNLPEKVPVIGRQGLWNWNQ